MARSNVVEKVRFPGGVRQALAWAIATVTRDGYITPSLSRLMGAGRAANVGLSQMERHGEASFIIGVVERLTEVQQAAIWFRTGVLPHDVMQALAAYLAPHVGRHMPTGMHSQRAMRDAILKTAGLGPGIRAFKQELRAGQAVASEYVKTVAEKLDALGALAEAEVEQEMIRRGWV